MSADARLHFRSCALAVALLAALAHECLAAPLGAAAPPAQHAARAPEDGRLSISGSPGKPQPPISIAHRLSAAPAVGVPLVVTITARVDPTHGALTLDVRPDDGVSVQSSLTVVAAGPQLWVWQIGVTPLSSAAGRLNVLVTAESAAGSYARSIVVPIETAARPRSAMVRAAEDGERVVVLPVDEPAARQSR